MKKKALSLLKISFLAALVCLAALFIAPIRCETFARFLLIPVEKRLHNRIEFTSSRIWLPGKISLRDVSVRDETGRLYYCREADITYDLFGLIFVNREIKFEVSEAKFYRQIGLLDSVADILTIEKMPDLSFQGIEGSIQLQGESTYFKKLYAYNDSLRIDGSGWVDANGFLDCEIKFGFRRDLADKIPDVVRSFLLTPEDGEWMAVSFKGEGNYKKPSLRIRIPMRY